MRLNLEGESHGSLEFVHAQEGGGFPDNSDGEGVGLLATHCHQTPHVQSIAREGEGIAGQSEVSGLKVKIDNVEIICSARGEWTHLHLQTVGRVDVQGEGTTHLQMSAGLCGDSIL